ncbi:hypothetical protein GTQ34_09620 [Muricauda sp. JGD-17]|uniref:DUF2306 domain-containing protein n=1 Tax=Flagellimonas ochracea TaxID=2696472 RepID=A0A964TC71_9FLAO|nr:hypothetical protein [Allomuricauda ochracea]NAY92177.1 hypothetical protein [Allomuricauda ochracea]
MLYTFVIIHIIAGTIALLSGGGALIFRKGGAYHGKTGNVFYISMLIMGVTAAGLAVYVSKPLSVVGGVLSCYLVVTSRASVRRKKGKTGVTEIAAMLTALIISVFAYYTGLEVLRSETGIYEGASSTPGPYFFFGSIALLGALLDAKIIWSGGVFGKQRIVRHLWRMCFALFIAAASLFLGQPQVFPKVIQGTFILALPVFLVIGTMLFWLIRVHFTKRFKSS